MKRKSIIMVVCLFVALITLSAIQVCAQKEFNPGIVPDGTLFYEEGPYKFYVMDGKAVIYSADESLSGDVTIPSTIGGYPVKGICHMFIFKDVVYSGYAWFPNATSLTVPGTVEYIGNMTTNALTTNIKKITLSYGVKTIASQAFFDFEGTELEIPESVTTIGAEAFWGSNIKRIHIPASVCNMKYDFTYSVSGKDGNPFLRMDKLEEITISPDNKYYTVEDGVLFNKDKSRIIHYMNSKTDATYVIPDSVTTIGRRAFLGSKIKHLVIPAKTQIIETESQHIDDVEKYSPVLTIVDALESISVSPDNKYFSSEDGILYNKDKTWLLKYPEKKQDSVYKIPESVHSMKIGAIEYTPYLKDLYIHAGIKFITFFAGASNFGFMENIYYEGSEAMWNNLDCIDLNGKWVKATDSYIKEDFYGNPTNVKVHFGITDVKDPDKATTDFGSEVSDWAKEEVEEAYDKGLVPEILVGKDLTEKIDRAEFAAIAVELYENMSGKKATAGNNPFVDVVGHPCESDIIKAYNLDVTTGTTATTFEPYANITREQMATMLTRAYKKSEFKDWTIKTDSNYPLNFMGVQKFADDSEISDYAKESVYFMARWEIINGVGDNKFAPKGNATVGESYGYATREQAIITAFRSAKVLK